MDVQSMLISDSDGYAGNSHGMHLRNVQSKCRYVLELR